MNDTRHYCPGCFKYRGEDPVCIFCGYDEARERSPIFLPHHTLLADQFVVGRALGEPGGFGVTYLAWDQVLRTQVAIKEYLPREFAGRSAQDTRIRSHTSQDEEFFEFGRQRFIEEARTLAQLQHPNVVRVRHVFSANDTTYLVMDFYDGLNLEQFCGQQAQPLPERQAIEVALAILDGLRHVHERGFLHRDVKPANIYLASLDSGNKVPILLDFGSARVALSEKTRSMDVVLTQGYAPIEQYYDKGHQGPWTDVYAVSATLYWLLTGQASPEAAARVQGDTLVAPRALVPELSEAISDAIVFGLGVMPEDRPQSALALQELLLAAAPDLVEACIEPSPEVLFTQPPKSSPWLTASAAILLLTLMSLSGWLWANNNQPPVATDDHWSIRPVGKIRLDVLHNDQDLDGDRLQIQRLSTPLHGSTHLELDGSIGYTPDPSYFGPDRFSYLVSDGEQERRAEVTLNVEKTRILVWAEGPNTTPEVSRLISALKTFAPGRSELETTITLDPDVLRQKLTTSHAFVMPPQLLDGESARYRTVALSLAPLLEDFVQGGGRVIALCDQEFLKASNLMTLGERRLTVNGGKIVKSDDGSIVQGLPSQFETANLTCSYELHDDEAKVFAHLDGRAVVAVRQIGDGLVILNGFSYTTEYQPMNQILINAVFGARGDRVNVKDLVNVASSRDIDASSGNPSRDRRMPPD